MLTFDESAHRYFWDGRPVPGASELLETIKKPFDAVKWSVHVARRDGLTVPQVLAEWDKKRDDACDRGHELHEAIDATLRGDNAWAEEASSHPRKLPAFNRWLDWWSLAQFNLVPLVTEHRMCSPSLWVAGTMDTLYRSAKTGSLHVFDYKSNAEIRTCNKYGDRLLRPFNDLHDCERNIYAVQVAIYRILAEQEFDEPFGDSWLLHLTPDAAVPYRLPDLRSRVKAWLMSGPERVARTVAPCQWEREL